MKNRCFRLVGAPLALLVSAAGTHAQSGDFNGDTQIDFIVGAPCEDIGARADSGCIWVFYGGSEGIDFVKTIGPDAGTLGATLDDRERFGECICVGNFNGDRYTDAAISVPNPVKYGSATHGAAVVILFGSSTGLNPASATWIFMDDADVAGYGASLAAADFNGDGKEDLAVGAPDTSLYEQVFDAAARRFVWREHPRAGRVYVYTSSGTAPLANVTSFDYVSLGLGLSEANYSSLGSALAAGDFNKDGTFDLAAGAPLHAGVLSGGVVVTPTNGAVHVLYGSASGLSATGRQILRPGTEIKAYGAGTVGDVLAAGRFNGDTAWDLAIGCPKARVSSAAESAGGGVYILHGASTKFKTDRSETLLSQDTAGILDQTEAGDDFGASLAVGRLNDDVHDDLVVGVPNESIGKAGRCGAVQVVYGSSVGLTATNNQFLNEGAACETGDQFGFSVAATRLPVDRWTGAPGDLPGNLIIGVPGQNLAGGTNAGSIHVFRGGTLGVQPVTGHVVITQDTASVPGAPETGDRFGDSLGAR